MTGRDVVIGIGPAASASVKPMPTDPFNKELLEIAIGKLIGACPRAVRPAFPG